jgi:hypothetical protein
MVAAAVLGSAAIGAVASGSAASKASKSNNKATAAQQEIAWAQQDLADEQWAYNRDVYQPFAMEQMTESMAMQKQLADFQMAEAEKNRALADESFGQAKKSWKYQDEYMKMTDEYIGGSRANTMADEANADVEQAYGSSMGQLSRNAARYGIDMGSGAMASAMGDMYSSKTLAAAGAQTAARRLARDKAEQMVGIAAGAGQAGFGTGLGAAGLATGAAGAASGSTSAGVNGMTGIGNSINAGYGSASNSFGRAADTWHGSTQNGPDPFGSWASGMVNSGIKVGSANGWFTPSNTSSIFRTGDPYASPNYFGGMEGE